MISEHDVEGYARSNRAAWHASRSWLWPVAVLAICHAAAVTNAQIVNILVDPIKQSLGASDTQISLLQGFAVAIAAAILGIPIARLADRGNRRRILVTGVAIWSAASIGCGMARTFEELLAARALVGIGEVFLFPIALSMIADIAPKGRLSTAIALFGCGGPVGAAAALIGGGYIVGGSGLTMAGFDLAPWRVAFLAGGVVGLTAVALLATIGEPSRVECSRAQRSVLGVFDHLWRHGRAYSGTIVGLLALSLGVFATIAWAPTLLIRVHGFSPAAAGELAGLAALLCAIPGAWIAGTLADKLDRPSKPDGVIRTAILVSALLIPIMLGIGFTSSPSVAGGLLCVAYALLSMPTVLGGSVLQQLAPSDLRAQITAVYILLVNLISLGLGPTLIALIMGHGLAGTKALGPAIAVVNVTAALLAIAAFSWARGPFAAKRCADADRASGRIGLAEVTTPFAIAR